MKELPKVFQNQINKKFDNNKTVYYSNNNEVEAIEDSRTVIQKINDIFSSPNYIYKANVEIITKDGKVNKRIIGRNKEFIITMDNKLIPIKDIIDIKQEKNKR